MILKNFVNHVRTVLPEHIELSDVDIWFQDETRIGQQGSITRVWHYCGQRPRVVRQQQFESAYLFGAFCPSTGNSVGLVLPYVNKQAMQLHMQHISKEVPEGRHAVVVMDGALWHQADLNLHNVTMLKLPPYSPELNPSEQIWQYLKQHDLSNRCFDGYDAIVDAACVAWNRLRVQLELIRSITSRAWSIVC
ncbi:IS630 family transposase [Paralysiella testudinis]|uniref:IS630 family transposase n=1 Tax=Paralysiella testudinis TaxID=2809020 RepID=A0A892ZFV8_9NEIS|nr:IS630 family transposase [Paralysiella testudinis]QRQ80737.1 IS630 family transposase [Paralysiella testudinis]